MCPTEHCFQTLGLRAITQALWDREGLNSLLLTMQLGSCGQERVSDNLKVTKPRGHPQQGLEPRTFHQPFALGRLHENQGLGLGLGLGAGCPLGELAASWC